MNTDKTTKENGNLPIFDVSQRSELLSFIQEVAEWDKDYSSTRLRLKAKELIKLNCC